MQLAYNALQQYGPSPGAQVMLDRELAAARHALETGIYAVWRSDRSPTEDFCTRIGPDSMCFCTHLLKEHNMNTPMVKCRKCKCQHFEYIPTRPEEVGEWWLPRRKDCKVVF